MAHISANRKKIINRLKRIKGQIEGIERLVEDDGECFKTLQSIAACRGAINGLFSELAQEHILHHIVSDPKRPTKNDRAALDLADIIKSYWK